MAQLEVYNSAKSAFVGCPIKIDNIPISTAHQWVLDLSKYVWKRITSIEINNQRRTFWEWLFIERTTILRVQHLMNGTLELI